MKQKFYSQVNMERIFFFLEAHTANNWRAEQENSVPLRFFEAAPIGAIQGGGVAARYESALGAP
jgi:hypothetical protein